MISAVICTHNPIENYLNEVIDAVLSQVTASAFELLIVDNASSRAIEALPVIRDKSIKVIKEPRLGLTAARECAARNATGDIIVFIDDDNVLEPGYLATVDKIFQNPALGVVSGTVLPRFSRQPEQWFDNYREMLALREYGCDRPYLTTIPHYNLYFPIGAGMAIRKSIVLDYFDSLTDSVRIEGRQGTALSSGEDIDIDLYAIYKGYLIGTFPQLKLIHIIPPNRCELSYIRKLAKASVASTRQINDKWKNVFKQAIFDHYQLSRLQILAHLVLRLILYPVKRYRVAFDVYLELLLHTGKTFER